jgi:SpoVK/Ycf46/Vps4 family AAA+-type ATPase
MLTKAYRQVFLEYQQGHISAVSMFSQPNDQKRDPLLSDEDKASLQDAVAKAAKGNLVTVLLCGHSINNKALIINKLAKLSKSMVYHVDMTELCNKYIGETEKNLARMIAETQSSQAILFFDEADALFGNRTDVKNAHDKYANQEVSYLLKLCTQHPGLYVLASDDPKRCELLQKRMSYVLSAINA